jgi:hypothetical protein
MKRIAFLILGALLSPSLPAAGLVEASLRVPDPAAFRAAWDAGQDSRAAQGWTGHLLLKEGKGWLMLGACADPAAAKAALPALLGPKAELLGARAWKDLLPPAIENGKPGGGRVIVLHKVKDSADWLGRFAGHGKHRHDERGYVATGHSAHEALDSPGQLLVMHRASDLRAAKTYMNGPKMSAAFRQAGALDIPTRRFAELVEEKAYPRP